MQNARAVCSSLEAIQTTETPEKPSCVLSPCETVAVSSKTGGKKKNKIWTNLEIICSAYFLTESPFVEYKNGVPEDLRAEASVPFLESLGFSLFWLEIQL